MCKKHGPFLYGGLMRDFLNAILAFIGTSSLTDLEFDQLETDLPGYGYDLETFEAMKALLFERDEVTETSERLSFYFQAKGLDVDGEENDEPKSNIFIGSAL